MQVDTFSDLLSSLADLDSVFDLGPGNAAAAGARWTVTTGAQLTGPAHRPTAGNPTGFAPAVYASAPSKLEGNSSSLAAASVPKQFTSVAAPVIKQEPSGTGTTGKRGRSGTGPSGGVKEQISELEAQLTRKLAELAMLEQQNIRLKNRGRMLEVVIRARDEQVERLKKLREQIQQLQEVEGTNSTATTPTLPIPDNTPATSAASRAAAAPAAPFARASDATSGQHLKEQHSADSATAAAAAAAAAAVTAAAAAPVADPGHMLLEPLHTLDAKSLQLYNKMSLEQLMGLYHGVIAVLTAELLKPGQGRLVELMHNLREFSRAMALMSDKLQLLVSRDVSTVQPMTDSQQATAQGLGGPSAGVGTRSHGNSTTSSSQPSYSGDGGSTSQGVSAARGASGDVPLADAASVLAASLVPSMSGGMHGTGGISDSVSHVGLQGEAIIEAVGESGANKETPGSMMAMMQMTGPETQLHWARVAASLDLTPQQRADACALWELHEGWLARVHADRQRLGVMLDEVLNVNKYGNVYQEGLSPNGFTEAQVLKRLHKSVQSEHALLMLIGEVWSYQILSLEQAAKVLIQSWPLIPDTIGILHAAAKGGSS